MRSAGLTAISALAAVLAIGAGMALGHGMALGQESAAPESEPEEAARGAVEAPEPEEAGDEPVVEDSAILPSADDHEASRAPSMDLDCENSPEDCVTPLEGSSEGPVQTSPDDPSTATDESDAGATVTTEP